MASVGQIPTDEELAEMIRIADADGSGSVDFYEFVTLMAHKMADVKSDQHLRAAFSIFDYTGDGRIQAEELRNIMMNVGEPVTIGDVNSMIREVDVNDDGVVDFEEFAKVVRSEKAVPFDDGTGPKKSPAMLAAEEKERQRQKRRAKGRRRK